MAVSLGSQLSKLAAPISEPFAKCLPRLGDWSKNIGGGGGGSEHLEVWLIKNT